MRLVDFGIRSKYLLFPFVIHCIYFLRTDIRSIIHNYCGSDITSPHKMDHHPLILEFISIFGDVIAGSLNVFNYFRVKLLKEDKHLTFQAESDTVQPFNRILTAHSEESYCFSLCKY